MIGMSNSASPENTNPSADKFLQRIETLSEVALQPAPSTLPVLADLLPIGLAALIGLPTSGKTYLAILQALAVCTGLQNGEIFPLQTGSVLYFTTETSKHEICSRAMAYLQQPVLPRNFFVCSESGENFEDWFCGFETILDCIRDVKIAVLDPFVPFLRGLTHGNYATQYRVYGRLRKLAKDREMALLLVGHCTKKASNRISSSYGSAALPACADALQTIDREKGTLTVSGNTLQDQVYEITSGSDYPPYLSIRLNPGLQDIRLTPEQMEVFMQIARSPLPQTSAKQLERFFSGIRSGSAVRQLLGHLKEKGLILPFRRGLYQLSDRGTKYFNELETRRKAQSRLRDHWGRLARFMVPDLNEIPAPTAPNSFFVEPDYDPSKKNFTDDLEDEFQKSLGRGSEDRPSPDREPTKLAEAEPSAENPVVIEDDPVIEPELEAEAQGEVAVDTLTEADPPDSSGSGDHEDGKEEAGPSGPPFPSEDPASVTVEPTVPKIEDRPIVRPSDRPDADRPSAEARRDALGVRISKMPSAQGSNSVEAYRDSMREKFLDGVYRSPSTFILHLDDPFDLSDLADRPALAKVFEKHTQERVRKALDLWVRFADLKLWACRCDQNRKIQLLPVTGESLPAIRPDGKACYQARHDACPENLKESLADLEPILCLLMGEDPWAEVTSHLMSGYLSVWESERIFENLHKKGRSGRTGTGLKPAEQTHALLILRQSPFETQAPLPYLANCPERVAYPLRRRQIRESLGLPTWPGDRVVR
jgi:hypothetical protein